MTDYFVSPDGDDGNEGTAAHPFRTIMHAATSLEGGLRPGDKVLLSTGVYYEHVLLKNLGVEGKAPIVLASREGHHATIDAAYPRFVEHPEDCWDPVLPDDPVIGAARDLPGPDITPFAVREYISRKKLPPGTDRGAFAAGRASYTRLVTHHRREDLRAINQGFGKLPEVPQDPPGPMVAGDVSDAPRRPWVYMGPGLWQDDKGHVHVRLSHTTHAVEGVTNYRGQTDPRKLPLAIWGGEATGQALAIRECRGIRVRDLTLRHGASQTVLIAKSDDIRLDHVVVRAGPYGIRMGEDCSNIRIADTLVDGGVPPWFFRGDRKDQYKMAGGGENLLGKRTTNLLLSCEPTTTHNLLIEQCEFVNGHDLQLAGENVTFARNWVRNLNDDGIFVGEVATNMQIRDNVIEQCLMAVNVTNQSDFERQVFVHRNLIDLRLPTVGRRPHPTEVTPTEEVFRFGNLLKDTNPLKEGKKATDLAFTHNTVLVVNQEFVSSYNLFRKHAGPSLRRAYNNIFVAINRTEASDLPIAYLPKLGGGASRMDGNCYHRMGRRSAPLLKVRGTPPTDFADMQDLHDSNFDDTTGFEVHGTDANPRLARYWPPFELPGVEDLRLAKGSPVREGGVDLAGRVDEVAEPTPPRGPARGCYPFKSPPLRVGVDNRRRFPGTGLTDPVPPLLTDS